MCPAGAFDFYGYGQVSLTNSGYFNGGEGSVSGILYDESASGSLSLSLNDRTYMSDSCDSSAYSNTRYAAVKLLGKRIRFSTSVKGADCGCNMAMYLVSMSRNNQSSSCHDFYCDANKVCGVECTEIDIMEANMYSWHSTLHSHSDRAGLGAGYGGGAGWNGPRDFTSEEYGPGAKCIDTKESFQVTASFPVGGDGSLIAMEVELTQEGKDCPLKMRVANYKGMAELAVELWRGMTPVLSYWKSEDMLWMDGVGSDGKGPCKADTGKCEGKATFWDFSVENLPGARVVAPAGVAEGLPASPAGTLPGTLPAHPGDVVPMDDQRHDCTETGEDCRLTHCCKSPGMQCYEKNMWWAACEEACVPGYGKGGKDTTWSCRPLGQRTPDVREHGLMMLSVAKQEVLPEGSEVIVIRGDKQLLAKVIEREEKNGEGGNADGQPTAIVAPAGLPGPVAGAGNDHIRSAEALAQRAGGHGGESGNLDGSLANKTSTPGPSVLHA